MMANFKSPLGNMVTTSKYKAFIIIMIDSNLLYIWL